MDTLKELINNLKINRILKSSTIIKAFNSIDRRDFVPQKFYDDAYGDFPLTLAHGQTISQPTTVAFMLELLQAQTRDKILDVGSGSGWTTALLASIVGVKGKVYGVELLPELVRLGNDNLSKYNFSQAEIVQAGKTLGIPQKAPFDKILVSAASEYLPEELTDQLKEGGSMVIPVKQAIWKIKKIKRGALKIEKYEGFIFVPLITDGG